MRAARPGPAVGDERARHQVGLVAQGHGVGARVDACYIERPRCRHAKALALAHGVADGAAVPAEHRAVRAHDVPLGKRPPAPALDERGEVVVGNEADALAIPLRRVLEAVLARDAAHVALFREPAQGEQHMGELLLREPIEEVALVLGSVDGLHKGEGAAFQLCNARIMPRCQILAPEFAGMGEQGTKLDALVADGAGVGRGAQLVGAAKRLDHVAFERVAAVEYRERYAEPTRHGTRVLDIGEVAACARGVAPRGLGVVETHRDADAVIAGRRQQVGGNA